MNATHPKTNSKFIKNLVFPLIMLDASNNRQVKYRNYTAQVNCSNTQMMTNVDGSICGMVKDKISNFGLSKKMDRSGM